MKRVLTILLTFLTISLFGQDIKPISPNFKPLQSPSFSYYTTDSSVWIYKGATYGWTKLASARNVINNQVTGVTVSGTNTKTFTLTQIYGGTKTTTFTDLDQQTLSVTASGTTRTITISSGNSVGFDVADNDNNSLNVLQTISTSGAAGNITLSNSGGTLNLNVNDADASVTNEIQGLTKVGNTLGLTQTSTTVDLSVYVNPPTGNLTESIVGLQFDNTRQIIGGSADLGLTPGYGIPTTTQIGNIHTPQSDNQTISSTGTAGKIALS